jgi:hypothetical protein
MIGEWETYKNFGGKINEYVLEILLYIQGQRNIYIDI